MCYVWYVWHIYLLVDIYVRLVSNYVPMKLGIRMRLFMYYKPISTSTDMYLLIIWFLDNWILVKDVRCGTPLIAAAVRGNISVYMYLVQKGANPDYPGTSKLNTCIHILIIVMNLYTYVQV